MSDKKPNQKRFTKRAPVEELTPEKKAEILAAAEKRVAEQKAEQERLHLYEANVKTMSHVQLVGELRRTIKREYAGRPPQPQPGLTIAWASVLKIVLENTRTARVFETDQDGRPTRVARLDQINRLGRLHSYPR